MAAIRLYCHIYGDEPAYTSRFSITTSPAETIEDLRSRMYEKRKAEYTKRDPPVYPEYLRLVTPKKNLSTVNQQQFKHEKSQIDFEDEENPHFIVLRLEDTVAAYDALRIPVKDCLHIVIVISTGKCNAADYFRHF